MVAVGLTLVRCSAGARDTAPSTIEAALGHGDTTFGQEGVDDNTPTTALHYWNALAAVTAHDAAEALHHLDHAIGVASGDRVTILQEVAQAVRDGDFHAAEHALIAILAATEPYLLADLLHLQLALGGLETGNLDAAVHHVSHFLAMASGDLAIWGRGALSSIEDERPAAAEEQLRIVTRIIVQRRRSEIACQPGALGLGPDPPTLRLLVAFDEEWQARFGQAALDTAVAVVAAAGEAMADLGVTLVTETFVFWESPDAMRIHDLGVAFQTAPLGELSASVRVLLSGQTDDDHTDGIHYHAADTHAIVVEHRDLTSDEWLLVHELGHHVGLWHEIGTYMQPLGFPANPGWSDCQRRAVAPAAA